MSVIRTDNTHVGFQELVRLLDRDLAVRDGDEHAFYHQFNGIEVLNHVVVIEADQRAVACAAIKAFDASSMEVKRMFVLPEERGKGHARELLCELEQWARELGKDKLVLETGIKQPEAIRLYESSGFQVTDNFGPYVGIANSLCYEKNLST